MSKMVFEVCVHCSVSLDNCPTYVRTKDIYNSPVGRAELIIAVLKAESLSGRIFGKAVGARAFDEKHLEKISTRCCLLWTPRISTLWAWR